MTTGDARHGRRGRRDNGLVGGRVRRRRRRRPARRRTPARRPRAGRHRRLPAAVHRPAPGDPVDHRCRPGRPTGSTWTGPTSSPPAASWPGSRPTRSDDRPADPSRWHRPTTTSMPPGRASSPATTRRSMSRGARGPWRRTCPDPRDRTVPTPRRTRVGRLEPRPRTQPSLLDGLDTFGADLPDEDEEGYTPPAPPPLPRPSLPTALGLVSIVAGLIVFLSPESCRSARTLLSCSGSRHPDGLRHAGLAAAARRRGGRRPRRRRQGLSSDRLFEPVQDRVDRLLPPRVEHQVVTHAGEEQRCAAVAPGGPLQRPRGTTRSSGEPTHEDGRLADRRLGRAVQQQLPLRRGAARPPPAERRTRGPGRAGSSRPKSCARRSASRAAEHRRQRAGRVARERRARTCRSRRRPAPPARRPGPGSGPGRGPRPGRRRRVR